MQAGLQFSVTATSGKARAGVLKTAHGEIETPVFMPVGTVGTVKGLTPEMVKATGAPIILGNTYHLMLRPGAERVAKLGGLRKFMRWDGPVLTDSGGFQVMSLNELRTMSEQCVTFKSHLDGSMWELSPERAVEIQHLLGSTITMVLDECTPFPATYEQAKSSMELSMRWAARSKNEFMRLKTLSPAFSPKGEGAVLIEDSSPFRERLGEGYGLFGIQQGSMFQDLRAESSEALISIGFDGYAIGGLAVGEGQEQMLEVLDYAVDMLPAEKPRYLMGVGMPSDIVEAVRRGVDMFDCVIPTRSGRFGRAFIPGGEINIRNAKFADDDTPLCAEFEDSYASKFSRAYIHHLFKASEMLGPVLLSWHNIYYYQWLTSRLRDAIKNKKELIL